MSTTRSSGKTATTPEATSVSEFRNLYTRVLLGLQAHQHQVLGVTSAIDGEGKTTIAAGLAAALAEDGALLGFGQAQDTILLIECNTGNPPEDPRLVLQPGPGLIQVLTGECELDDTIRATELDRLAIMSLGEPAQGFPLAIRTPAFPGVLDQLRARFGLIVLDLPAVLNSTDTQILSRLVDQVVLVVRAGVTPAKLVQQAVDQLGEEILLGVVLNDSRPELPPWLDHRL